MSQNNNMASACPNPKLDCLPESAAVTEDAVVHEIFQILHGYSGTIFEWTGSIQQTYVIKMEAGTSRLCNGSVSSLLASIIGGASSLRRLVSFTKAVRLNTITNCSGNERRPTCSTLAAFTQAVQREIESV